MTDTFANQSPEHDHASAQGGSSVNQFRVTLPRNAWELIVATVLALAILTCWNLWTKLHDAEKDIQTQIWLRSDALSKENSDLRGHIIAMQDLLQAYGIAKTIPKIEPLPEEKSHERRNHN
jgi:predicted negative regulator of RcsB-dependent stress response